MPIFLGAIAKKSFVRKNYFIESVPDFMRWCHVEKEPRSKIEMKKIIKEIIKVIMAGGCAICILSLLLLGYYNIPFHIENEKGNTDYVWKSGASWTKMTEGISWGTFDANGYNNLQVINDPDIIILGSSHMEATNVMQNQNVAYLLNESLKGKYSTYNMGISGHDFYKVCKYLPNNLTLFKHTPKVIIIETSTVLMDLEHVNEVLEGTVAYSPSYSSGLISTLQKSPFFRLLYLQINGGLVDLFMPEKNDNEQTENNVDDNYIDQSAYDLIFNYIGRLQQEYDTNIVIVYHPYEKINVDGTISFEKNEGLENFSTTAEKYGIDFLDMTDEFVSMYYEDHHVAHGFSTGRLGTGHLNKYGHKAIFESLEKEINKLEGEQKLCR